MTTQSIVSIDSFLATTVFHGTRNFELSAEFARFYVSWNFAEFVLVGDKWTNTNMTATWTLTGKYWAELIWNIASLFDRKTAVSVSCSYWRQILHIWSVQGAVEYYLLTLCGTFAAEFGKLSCFIWKYLPRKTVVPILSHLCICIGPGAIFSQLTGIQFPVVTDDAGNCLFCYTS